MTTTAGDDHTISGNHVKSQSVHQKRTPKTDRLSDVWEYMKKNGNDKAICNICGITLCRKNGNTTGLRKHLNQLHHIDSFPISSNNKRKRTEFVSAETKKRLDSLLVHCIIRDGRSFGDLSRPGMIRILNHFVPGYVPPHRHTVQRQIEKFYQEQQGLLIERLAHVKYISVTCDLWSDKRLQSYICLTGHYITNDFNFVSEVIAFSTFNNRHYSVAIGNTIKTALTDLKIYEKVTAITTDGAPNMIKVFDSYCPELEWLHCFAHRLHLVVCNSLGLWLKPEEDNRQIIQHTSDTNQLDRDACAIDHHDIERSISDFISNGISLELNGRTASPMSVSERSDVHDESINEDTEDDEIYDNDNKFLYNCPIEIDVDWKPITIEKEQLTIGRLMQKCRSFVKILRESSVLTAYVNNLRQELGISKLLQPDCRNRWNSTYRLIETLLLYKKIIEKLMDEKEDIKLKSYQKHTLMSIDFDRTDWNILESLQNVLRPFVGAIKLISGTKYTTIGLGVFAITQLNEFLNDTQPTKTNQSRLFFRLKELLLANMKKYFEKSQQQWLSVKKYAYFDPMGYGSLNRTETRSIELELEQIIIENKISTSTLYDNIVDDRALQKIEMSKVNNSSVMNFISTMTRKTTLASNEPDMMMNKPLIKEFMTYRSLAQSWFYDVLHDKRSHDAMEFWRTYRHQMRLLSVLAIKYLPVPCTTVPSESTFSIASHLLCKKRSRLTAKNLCYSVFLRDKIDFHDL